MISTLYETCDWFPVRNNGVFAADVAEYIRLISARPSGRIHIIYLKKRKMPVSKKCAVATRKLYRNTRHKNANTLMYEQQP